MNFDLDGDGPSSLKRRLLKCCTKSDGISPKKQADVHNAIEHELFYLVCWNRSAFPEIAQKKGEFNELFPPLFPGSYVSMYSLLKADGVNSDELDFLSPDQTGSTIYKALLKRVQSKAPHSSLLHAEPVPLDTHPDFLQKRHGESRKKFNKRKKRALEELPTPPLNLLTLALTVENFQTGLVRTMEDARAANGRDVEKVKETVEALMYRLAIKEPSAFPEVFSFS